MDKDNFLVLRDLKKYFPVKGGFFKRIKGYIQAVDGVNLVIKKGETFALNELPLTTPDTPMATTITMRGIQIFLSPNPTALTLSQYLRLNKAVPRNTSKYPSVGRKNRTFPLIVVTSVNHWLCSGTRANPSPITSVHFFTYCLFC